MKNLTSIFVAALVLVLLCGSVSVWAGQNASAGIRIDFNYTTSGDQGENSMSPPGTGATVWLEVHVTGASNLDTYEFNLNYPSSDLTFNSAYEDNPFSDENNFLKKNGGSTTGWGATDYGTYVNISNTLVGDQGENTPDGGGLLALMKFTTKVDAPGNLTFGDVDWYDNAGVKDVCTDKGDASLPVELSLFEAEAGDGEVTLRWTTESEIDNMGFHVYRALSENGEYERLTAEVIQGAGTATGRREYAFTDVNITNGVTYWYKLEDVDYQGTRTMHGPIAVTPQIRQTEERSLPDRYDLAVNYPNPFNPSTTIAYQLPEPGYVTLTIYDLLGQEVRLLVSERHPAGWYRVSWDGSDEAGQPVSSGVYLYRMETEEDFVQVRKALLLR